MSIIKGRLSLWEDTAANLAAQNRVFLPGEPVAEVDTGVIKIGDGTTPYNNLPDPHARKRSLPLNAADFGVVGDGATNTTAQVTAARQAAVAQSRPLYFPAGTYLFNSGALAYTGEMTLRGDGAGRTIFKAIPGATGSFISHNAPSTVMNCELSGFTVDLSDARTATGVNINRMSRSTVRDVAVNYGAYGVRASNFGTSVLERVHATNQTSAGISINGDGAAENHLRECFVFVNDPTITMAAGIELVRTTTLDTGGIYLTNCRITKPAGTMQTGYRFTSSGGICEVFAFFTACVADNIDGPNLLLDNVGNVRCVGSWFQAGSTGAGVRIVGNGSIMQFVGNTVVKSGGGFEMTGNPTQLSFVGNRISSSSQAFVFGGQPTAMHASANIVPSTLTNNADVLARASTTRAVSLGMEVLTHSTAGGSRTFMLSNEVGQKKYLRVSASGALEVLNNAFTGQSLSVTDAGSVTIPGHLNHTGPNAGFFGNAPQTRPVVAGSRGGNQALTSLLAGLASLGLITNNTTA